MVKKYFWRIGAIVIVFVSFFAGMAMDRQLRLPTMFFKVHDSGNTYEFIDPLLAIETPNHSNAYDDLRNQISAYIKTQQNKNVENISFYVRDLNSANWTGVNENDIFVPGSLTKVLLMIAYFKYAETNPQILDKNIYYSGKFDYNSMEGFKPKNPILPQHWYSAAELIESMIEESDNNALNLLSNNIDTNFFTNIASSLKIYFPSSINIEDFMSPKMYSMVFRVLYNSTFLSRPMSNEALRLLSNSSFTQGLKAGLPSDVVVAHKFGEQLSTSNQNDGIRLKELHDCGIVYNKERPYFICVMTKGMDEGIQALAIAEISRLTYERMKN